MSKTSQSIGLQRGLVSLSSYDPQWHLLFEKERNSLLKALGDDIINIEHIGSTSIPGMAAKPLIDMLIGVSDNKQYQKYIDKLVQLGYEYMPERITEQRAFFPKGARENRTHHLSFVVYGSDEWNMPIIFRDYLIANPQVAKEYQNTKVALAARYANDRYAYTQAKSDHIQSILDKATRH